MHSELKLITQHERGWWQVLLEIPKASGKLDAMFSCHSEPSQNTFAGKAEVRNRENLFMSSLHSVLRFADPANVGKSFLDGNTDHLLNQTRSDLMKQEHQVRSLNNCIEELQQQAYAQRLELQDAQRGYIESRREESHVQEELSMKEKVLRDTRKWNKHEMGEIKRAQERRIDEVSAQITRRFSSSLPNCSKCRNRWIPWTVLEEEFSKLWDVGCKICFCFE